MTRLNDYRGFRVYKSKKQYLLYTINGSICIKKFNCIEAMIEYIQKNYYPHIPFVSSYNTSNMTI